MAKVLLVEDDNNLREIYEARLQAEGYQIATARDGEEALVVAKQEHPDLVISDVMMPKISGFEMLDILRNTDGMQAVKVIMLTALGQNDDQQRANQLGADRYLVKSQVTLEDIVRVAHELLGDTPAAAAPAADDSAATTDATSPAAVSDDAAASTSDDTSTPADPVVPEPAAATDIAKEEAAVDAASESTTQEEAAVDAKIEDFVSGASSEATPPVGSVIEPEIAAEPAAETAPEATPTEPTDITPTETPTTPPEPTVTPASENAESNDALLAEAVDKLVGNTAKPEPAPAEPASTAPVLPVTEESKGSVGGDKVITPLAAAPTSAPVVNDVTPTPTAAAAPPADPSDPNDPRNLAL
jgi:CheY-like chemotaxis protein